MAAASHPERVIRFGAFELDPEAGELRKSGIRLKLAEQPLRILIRLLDQPGEIVTREELRELLWGNDTFVDFEHGLNAAANKLREALGDSAATPRFIETVPRRGYRFIAEVQRPVPVSPPIDGAAPTREFPEAAPPSTGKPRKWPWLAACVLLLLFGAGGAWWWAQHRSRNIADWEAHPLTADEGLTTMPAISPDGKWVAYASDRATGKDLDIWVQPFGRTAEPVRLTRHAADEEWPSFSPDGAWIAFSSARDGGGVYLVPTLGGNERLLARGCAAPRFSPDGQWVVCSAGGFLRSSRVFVVPVGGGTLRQLAPNVGWAVEPVFSPDGRFVLIRGLDAANPREPHRLWLAPLDGNLAIPTKIPSELQKQGVTFRRAGDWLENRILFEGREHLWEVAFDIRKRRVTGQARRLTRGAATTVNLRAARSGGTTRIVFRVANRWRHLWRLKLDVNQGKALGEMEALEHSGGSQSLPASSADGRHLVYLYTQPGGASLRLRDLGTGAEQVLLSAGDYTRPKLSPDGATVGYHVPGDGIYVMPATGGAATKLLGFPTQVLGGAPGAQIYGWTPDSRQIVYWSGLPIRFSLLDVSTGISRPLISHPRWDIHGAELSPDQRWLAFHTPSVSSGPLWIVPVRDGQAGGEGDWIKVFNRGVDNGRPWWSRDGNLLYFISLLDGFPCIYAQRLRPGNKHPMGDPMPVYHFHSARVHPVYGELAFFGPAILPNCIIFSLVHEMGNVWYAESRE